MSSIFPAAAMKAFCFYEKHTVSCCALYEPIVMMPLAFLL